MNALLVALILNVGIVSECYMEEIIYEDLIYMAIHHCKNAKNKNIDEDILWDLVQVEAQYGVPEDLRGMLLAAACMESGYNTNAQGDHKFSAQGKPKAIGIFQMWGWWETKKWGYGIDRRNHVEASHAYMQHIVKMVNKTKKRCGYKTEKKRWIAGWVTAIRSPKKGGRCDEYPNHYSLLKKWYKHLKDTPIPCWCWQRPCEY